MQQTLREWIVGVCVLVCVGLMAGCHNHDLTSDPSEHTLLIYISGDNSLSSLADQNIRACGEGLLDSEEPLNLIIYKDNYGDRGQSGHTPSLFQMRVNAAKHRIDTIYLKRWDRDLDSSNPRHFSDVLQMVFDRFDTNVKGLEIWGHGRSWIPGHTWQPDSRATQFACVDSLNYMELWELREALDETDIHFNYILFDACFMGTAEVAYELRKNCDWLVGAPCEVPDKGFPYMQNIGHLSEVTGKPGENANLLPMALRDCVSSFGDRYADRGALSLFNEHAIADLHDAFWNMMEEHDAFYAGIADNPYIFDERMQHYGRSATGDRYHFYDLADFANLSGSDLQPYISQAVEFHFAAPQYYDGAGTVSFPNSCGMAITPTQFFSVSEQKDRLNAAYPLIEWGKVSSASN